MEEMPESHTLAGQIMVSLDILCDRPYVLLSSSSIHYCHNGGKAHVKYPVPSITATMEEMPESHTLAGQIMVSLDILCDRPYVLLSSSSIHYCHNGGKAHVKHPVPSITATMEEMPESHTLAGQIIVSLDILCDRPYVLLSSSSIHYRHNGGDARKVHVKHPVTSITTTMEGMPERHT